MCLVLDLVHGEYWQPPAGVSSFSLGSDDKEISHHINIWLETEPRLIPWVSAVFGASSEMCTLTAKLFTTFISDSVVLLFIH